MKHRTITATEFKAHRLALLDEVGDSGGTITVTKRGKPVATVRPLAKTKMKSLKGCLAGKVKITGDIVYFDSGLWNSDREADLL